MTELKPCPFCGGIASLVSMNTCFSDNKLQASYYIKCTNCGSNSKIYNSSIYQNSDGEIVIEHNGAEKAKNAWNKRYSPKETPLKPLPEERYFGNGKCPTCGAVFMDKSTNYCGNCGQKLDWGDSKK